MNALPIRRIILALGFLTFTVPSFAGIDQESRLAKATRVIEQLTLIPEGGIPPRLLRRAEAVAVLPNVIKGSFFIGGRRGKGLLVVRTANGEWSNPSFVTLTSGSIGWQFGGQSADLVLVFKSRGVVDDMRNGKITLGGNAAIAAGPVGRNTEAATDLKFDAEVYAYSRSRGLFAGVALEGSRLGIDEKSNQAYYGNRGITVNEVLGDQSLATPATARRFILALEAATPVEDAVPPRNQPVVDQETITESEESGVKTFGIEDPEASEEQDL